MSYDVLIRRNSDGEIRRYTSPVDWDDNSLYWWQEGNFGCDCNRRDCFERAGGREPGHDESPCGDEAFAVLKAILPDGQEIVIDEAPAVKNARRNQIKALVRKHGLGFVHNPGGGEFNRQDLGRCQISAQDDADDLATLLAWLRSKGIES